MSPHSKCGSGLKLLFDAAVVTKVTGGLPWQSSGLYSALLLPGGQV